MSMAECTHCGRYVDTDDFPDFYVDVVNVSTGKKKTLEICDVCAEQHIDEDGIYYPEGIQEMKQLPHTPTPWSVDPQSRHDILGNYHGGRQQLIANTYPATNEDYSQLGGEYTANAAFIVKAVNEYDELKSRIEAFDAMEYPHLKAINDRLIKALAEIIALKWNTLTQGCDAACEASKIAIEAISFTVKS